MCGRGEGERDLPWAPVGQRGPCCSPCRRSFLRHGHLGCPGSSGEEWSGRDHSGLLGRGLGRKERARKERGEAGGGLLGAHLRATPTAAAATPATGLALVLPHLLGHHRHAVVGRHALHAGPHAGHHTRHAGRGGVPARRTISRPPPRGKRWAPTHTPERPAKLNFTPSYDTVHDNTYNVTSPESPQWIWRLLHLDLALR